MKKKFNFNDEFYKKSVIERLEIFIKYYTEYKDKYSKIYTHIDPVQTCKCMLEDEIRLQKQND